MTENHNPEPIANVRLFVFIEGKILLNMSATNFLYASDYAVWTGEGYRTSAQKALKYWTGLDSDAKHWTCFESYKKTHPRDERYYCCTIDLDLKPAPFLDQALLFSEAEFFRMVGDPTCNIESDLPYLVAKAFYWNKRQPKDNLDQVYRLPI